MMKYLTIALLLFATASQAQTVIFEEDFTSGIPSTWTLFDEDGLIPDAAVAEFTEAWIGKISGTDTAAASTSYYDTTGRSNDFLVTPKISIGNFSRLVWSARSVDSSYPDGYQVLVSTTDSLPSSFTDTLMTITAELGYMITRSVDMDVEGYDNQDVFIAFRNNTDNGYILLIDDVKMLGAETASIDHISSAQLVSIYPNPTTEFININSSDEIIAVAVYSAAGQLLISDQGNRIDVSELNTGIYFVQINSTKGVETVQFLKH